MCCVLGMALARLTAAEDWPQFRGPTGQGISTATNVPEVWSATKNVAWKVSVPGQGWSSPVLVSGRVYLTTAIAKGAGSVSLRVMCFDAATGATVWDTEALRADAKDAGMKHAKNSPASPTVLVAGDRLYAHFGHMGTAALDLSGSVIWQETELKFPPVHGNGGSPALVGDELVFSCDGARDPFLTALDAKTGKVKWKSPRKSEAKSKFSFSTPLAIEIDGATQIISPASGFVGGYEPATGKELWRVRYGQGYSVVPRPVFSNGLLILSSGFDTPTLYAIRPEHAAGDVTDTNVAWTQKKGAPCTPSVVASEGKVYSISDNGIATCTDVTTGKMLWSHRLSGSQSASPFVAEGKVYFQNEEGVGFVIRAAEKFEQLAMNDMEERSLASVAVTDGALYIRTESHLWKIAGK